MIIGVDGRELQGRPTGTGRYVRNLLRVWSRQGTDRILAYFNGPAPLDAVLDHTCVVVRSLGSRPAKGLLWQESRLPPAARTDGIDVFFSPAYTCPLALQVPRVTAVHDLAFFSIPQDFGLLDGLRRRLLVGASIQASAAIVTISDFTRREVAARFPEAADRLVHVPLGPDDDLAPAPSSEEARRRLDVRGPLLLTVGSIFNRRCLPVLLRAVAGLARGRPSISLDVVGENRTHPFVDFGEMVRRLDLEGHVRLSGFVSEGALAERYAAADLAVFLSEYEGFGLPVLEAMCRGVPVVATRRPAVGEVFGDAALLVDPQDVAGVRDAIVRILDDSALRAELVSRGRALASRFSWDATATRTREVLASAAGT